MKFFLPAIFLIFAFTSCKKENRVPVPCLETTILQTGFSQSLSSVFFLDGKEGFASDYNGGIYKTNDSAKNWARLNTAINLPVRDLFFVDGLKGFAVGGQNSCVGTGCIPAGGFILKTLDGGQTWAKIYTPVDKIEIVSVFFVDASTGFCVGDNIILKTSDGGQTWSEYKVTNPGEKMMQVKFVNAQKGYIPCLSGKVIKTENGGLTWEVTMPRGNIGYYSVSGSNGSVYISGQGKMIKSTNGGISWSELTKSPDDVFAIHFINDKKGFAFGRGNYSGGDFGYSYGSIYCTDDGGDTWNGSADLKDIGLIQSVSFPTINTGYAVTGNKVIRLTVK